MPRVPLLQLAAARSGDKNNICNIGVLARKPELYPVLARELTPERVKAHLGGLVLGPVDRYEWPSIEALNFVCHQALDGGASRSMRMDMLGKNFSSLLLLMELDITPEEAALLN